MSRDTAATGRLVLLACVLLALAPPLAGQADTRRGWQPELTAAFSLMPLYRGDATVGSQLGVGPAIGLGVLSPNGRFAIEAAYSYAANDNRTGRPRVHSVTGVVTRRYGSLQAGISGWIGAGLGGLWIRPHANLEICEPPGCSIDGGPGFNEANLITGVATAGGEIPVGANLGLRVDVRGLLPFNAPDAIGNSGNARLQFGAGVSWWP